MNTHFWWLVTNATFPHKVLMVEKNLKCAEKYTHVMYDVSQYFQHFWIQCLLGNGHGILYGIYIICQPSRTRIIWNCFHFRYTGRFLRIILSILWRSIVYPKRVPLLHPLLYQGVGSWLYFLVMFTFVVGKDIIVCSHTAVVSHSPNSPPLG